MEQEMVSFSFKVSFNEPYDSKQDIDDSLLIYFQAFLGGLTEKFIPSLKGSKESINSN